MSDDPTPTRNLMQALKESLDAVRRPDPTPTDTDPDL